MYFLNCRIGAMEQAVLFYTTVFSSIHPFYLPKLLTTEQAFLFCTTAFSSIHYPFYMPKLLTTFLSKFIPSFLWLCNFECTKIIGSPYY